MHKAAKSAEVDGCTATRRRTGVQVSLQQYLKCVVEGLDDRALACAVGSEEEGQRPQLEDDPLAGTLEVLEFDTGNHAALSSPRNARCTSAPKRAPVASSACWR